MENCLPKPELRQKCQLIGMLKLWHIPTHNRKFAYAGDLALLHFSKNWRDLEGDLHFQYICRLEVEALLHKDGDNFLFK